MAYSVVDPRIDQVNNYNPVQRDEWARAAGYTGYEDYRNQVNRGLSGQPQDVAKRQQEEDLKRSQQLFQETIKPAIQGYESQIPTTQKIFETERQRLSGESARLEERYNALISEIKGVGATAETRQTRATGAELARRGISQQSGVYGDEMNQALLPITQDIMNRVKSTGLEREDMLAKIRDTITGLTGSEQQAVDAIKQAILNLQSSTGKEAIQFGNTLSQQAIANALAQSQQALAERQQKFTESTKTASKPYEFISGAGGYVFDPNTGQIINTVQKLASGAGGTSSGTGSYYKSNNYYNTSPWTIVK
jgi:hypothetical protein